MVVAAAVLAATLVAVPLGFLGFAYQGGEGSRAGHGAAGYTMIGLTLAGPLLSCIALTLAIRTRPRVAVALLGTLVLAYAAWGVLLRAIVHSGAS